MNTTNARLELLILGFQALIWICLGAIGFVGYPTLKSVVSEFSSSQVFVIFITIGISYPIGVLVDRIADYTLTALNLKKIVNKIKFLEQLVNDDTEPDRVQMLAKEGRAHDLIDYSRGNLRIMRGSIINAPLISLTGALCAWQYEHAGIPFEFAILVVCAGILLLFLAVPLYAVAQQVHESRINELKSVRTRRLRGCKEVRRR